MVHKGREMKTEEKCHNCGKPNLIDRRNKTNDVFCGWCKTEYRRECGGLVLVKIHNKHLTARQKERIRLAKAV